MLTLHIVYDDVGSSQPNAIQQNGECECHLAEKIFTARNSSKEVVIQGQLLTVTPSGNGKSVTVSNCHSKHL